MQVFLSTAVLATVFLSSAGYQFGPICCDNPTNIIRGWDDQGSGAFGASRIGVNGERTTHKGVDIICGEGSTVYAPLDMTITRRSTPYTHAKARTAGKTAINDGLLFDAEGMTFRLWYFRPVKTSGSVSKGEKIGTMLSMAGVYPGITSHVHFQKNDKTDPESIINTQDEARNTRFCQCVLANRENCSF